MTTTQSGIHACRVLVVEDELMVGMLLGDMLTELGHTVDFVSTVDQAIKRIESNAVGIAIVDLNLNGESSFPVLDALMARAIPFVISTGYGRRGVPERYGAPPILPKPFGIKDLRRAVAAVQKPS